MSIYQENYTVYQPALQLPLSIVYEDAIPQNDISRTVKEVVERINIKKYIDISARNSYGYNARKMFECVLLAFALHGYASTRQLADYCRNDIRFMFIMNGFKPSHMAFHRFIRDDLKYGIEDIFIGTLTKSTPINNPKIEKKLDFIEFFYCQVKKFLRS